MDKFDCEKWAKNKLINPKTGRAIQEGKGVYNKIKEDCQKYLQSSSPSGSPRKSKSPSSPKEPKEPRGKSRSPPVRSPVVRSVGRTGRKRRANILIVDSSIPQVVSTPPIVPSRPKTSKSVVKTPPKTKTSSPAKVTVVKPEQHPLVAKSPSPKVVVIKREVSSPPKTTVERKEDKTVTKDQLYAYFNDRYQKDDGNASSSSSSPSSPPTPLNLEAGEIATNYFIRVVSRGDLDLFYSDISTFTNWIDNNDQDRRIGVTPNGQSIYVKSPRNEAYVQRVKRAIDATNAHYKGYRILDLPPVVQPFWLPPKEQEEPKERESQKKSLSPKDKGSKEIEPSSKGKGEESPPKKKETPKDPKGSITYKECKEWLSNKTVNPKSGRKIVQGKSVYLMFQKECEKVVVGSPSRFVSPSKGSPIKRVGKSVLKSPGPSVKKTVTFEGSKRSSPTIRRSEVHDYFKKQFKSPSSSPEGTSQTLGDTTPLNLVTSYSQGGYYLHGIPSVDHPDISDLDDWIMSQQRMPSNYSANGWLYERTDANKVFLERVQVAIDVTNAHFANYDIIEDIPEPQTPIIDRVVTRDELYDYFKERFKNNDNGLLEGSKVLAPLNIQIVYNPDDRMYYLRSAFTVNGQNAFADTFRLRSWILENAKNTDLDGKLQNPRYIKGRGWLYYPISVNKSLLNRVQAAVDATNTHFAGYTVV